MSVVYFVKHKTMKPIKIGVTSNLTKRLQALRVSCPYGLDLIGRILSPEPKELESKLHKRLKSKRLNGEWFDISISEAKDIISEYKPSKKDKAFIKLIESHFKTLSTEESKAPISLKDIVFANEKIEEMYFSTTMPWTLSLLNGNQSYLDTRNANLQPNPWEGMTFYWGSTKEYDEFEKSLCGPKLMKFVQNKEGLAKTKRDKIFSKF